MKNLRNLRFSSSSNSLTISHSQFTACAPVQSGIQLTSDTPSPLEMWITVHHTLLLQLCMVDVARSDGRLPKRISMRSATKSTGAHERWAHPVVSGVAAVIAGVGLQSGKVQNGVAAHQALQLSRAEQVDGRAPAQHHEPPRKRLKLQMCTKSANDSVLTATLARIPLQDDPLEFSEILLQILSRPDTARVHPPRTLL